MTVKERLKLLAGPIEDHLRRCLADLGVPDGLNAAMQYSLDAGGKRLRPALCLAFARLHGAADADIVPLACSLEFIHTYSLIHDDLPAMDDDDLRRGKPSNHKVFGEALAILAGDGLLTEAFGLLSRGPSKISAAARLSAVAEIASAAGAAGMVGGQAIDMELTGAAGVELSRLQDMHARKTGALITASCAAGAILAGAGADAVRDARTYGRETGMAFQIADDILDVTGDTATLGKPAGSDVGKGKTTYPSLLGIEQSRKLARQCAARAQDALFGYRGETAEFLRDLADYIVERVN